METRKKQILFLVNESEEKRIHQKMKDAGVSRLGVYMRKMAMDGFIIQLDLTDVKEVVRLLRINSNNLNQFTKKANETGSIYAEDVADLKRQQEELWKLMKQILKKLSDI